jgi:hypothetical protein
MFRRERLTLYLTTSTAERAQPFAPSTTFGHNYLRAPINIVLSLDVTGFDSATGQRFGSSSERKGLPAVFSTRCFPKREPEHS